MHSVIYVSLPLSVNYFKMKKKKVSLHERNSLVGCDRLQYSCILHSTVLAAIPGDPMNV